MIGFMATDEVSLKGSPTVSPTTVASVITSYSIHYTKLYEMIPSPFT